MWPITDPVHVALCTGDGDAEGSCEGFSVSVNVDIQLLTRKFALAFVTVGPALLEPKLFFLVFPEKKSKHSLAFTWRF